MNLPHDNIGVSNQARFEFFKTQIFSALQLFNTKDRLHINSIISEHNHNNKSATEYEFKSILYTIAIVSKNSPYCNKQNGESITWRVGDTNPKCECLTGVCHNGPYDNSIVYVMFILLIFALFVHIVINIWQLLKLRHLQSKFENVPNQRPMTLSSISNFPRKSLSVQK
jgi:hypothetical protein